MPKKNKGQENFIQANGNEIKLYFSVLDDLWLVSWEFKLWVRIEIEEDDDDLS